MGKWNKNFSEEDKAAYKDKLKEETKALSDKLEAGVADILNSDKYLEYLFFLGKFHNYSWSNALLIMLQMPEATHVAGFKTWQTKFKRNVKKGEKGIRIFAPAPIKATFETVEKDENGNEYVSETERRILKFKPTTVFDISQTEGEPIPEGIKISELTGEIENFNEIFEAIKKVAPCNIEYRTEPEDSKGAYYHIEKIIRLNPEMSNLQTLKTAIHETAHALMHDKDNSGIEGVKFEKITRNQREVEAESVAYIVASHFGLDTSDYSFGYVTSWAEEIKVFKTALDRIQKTAMHIIEGIENQFEDASADETELVA